MEKKTPDPIDVLVGSRLRMRRNVLGLSQEKLGDGVGITFQQIQKYEKGTNRIGASRLMAICNFLDVQPGFFFQNDSIVEPRETVGEPHEVAFFVSSKEGIVLNRAFAQIKDTMVRKKIVALAKALAGQMVDDVADPPHTADAINTADLELRT